MIFMSSKYNLLHPLTHFGAICNILMVQYYDIMEPDYVSQCKITYHCSQVSPINFHADEAMSDSMARTNTGKVALCFTYFKCWYNKYATNLRDIAGICCGVGGHYNIYILPHQKLLIFKGNPNKWFSAKKVVSPLLTHFIISCTGVTSFLH